MEYIYRIYNINNELIYVGKTKNIKIRMNQHKEKAFWWDEVHQIEYAEVEKKLVDNYEKYYINKGTKYNSKDTKMSYAFFCYPELTFTKYWDIEIPNLY